MRRFLTFDDVGLIPKFNTIQSRLDTNIGPTPQLITATTTAAMGANRGTDTRLLAMSAYRRGADRFAR